MRALLTLAFLLASTPSFAATDGFLCKLNLGGKQVEWDIAADAGRGIFTVRQNNVVVMSRGRMSVDYSLGGLTPRAVAAKFTVNLTPMDYFLVVRFQDGQAFLTPLSGSSPRQVGTCRDTPFKGL